VFVALLRPVTVPAAKHVLGRRTGAAEVDVDLVKGDVFPETWERVDQPDHVLPGVGKALVDWRAVEPVLQLRPAVVRVTRDSV
jgi:hypothetical protein